MKSQIIGIKQLYRELKKISEDTQEGKSFIVVKNSKPVFRIEPMHIVKKHRYTLADLQKVQFRTSDKNLSKKIDSNVYKI